MKKLFTLLIIFLAGIYSARSQNNCYPTDDCAQAPLLCGQEIENQVFSNNVPAGPGNFFTTCGIMPHNYVWFRIIPCDPDLALSINTLSTINGNGLQIAIYNSCDAGLELACNPGTAGGAFMPLELDAAVIPGIEYWIVVDGFDGDICDFQIDVLNGIDTGPPVVSPGGPFDGTITGPNLVSCPLGEATFTANWPGCSSWVNSAFACVNGSCTCIHWTIPPGAFIAGDTCANTVTINFAGVQTGQYLIEARPECLCGDVSCDQCGPVCCPVNPASFLVSVIGPQVLVLPEITLCSVADLPACVFEPGGYFSGQSGWCQSALDIDNCLISFQSYKLLEPAMNNLGAVNFCDTFWVCNTAYTQAGAYSITCTTPGGCDSIVTFELIQDPACNFTCNGLNLPAAPGDSCQASPFFCGSFLEHYCGSNTGLTDDIIGSTLFQNAGFIRFSSCSDSIVFHTSVGDCGAGTGLSFALFEGDCPDSGTVLNLENISENNSNNLIFTNLLPDGSYTLMVSGIGDSECEFSIDAVAGIGTAQSTPVTCNCVDGYIVGPDKLCPGDLGTFTIVPPVCTFSGGDPVGGNGYFCNPPTIDTFKYVWHIPPQTNFVGDSTGITIQIMADSAFFNFDTLLTTQVWAEQVWEPGPGTLPDSLYYCTGLSFFDDCHAVIQPKEFQIIHNIDYRFCLLTCANISCEIDGIIYSAPGNFIHDIDNCNRLIIQIDQDINMPNPPIVPPQSICQGDAVTLTVLNEQWPNMYFWSSGQVGISITVAPAVNTTYTIIASNPANGCISFGETIVEVIPPVDSNLGEIGVITCSQPCIDFMGQSYCAPGAYTRQTGPCSTVQFSVGSDASLPLENLPPVTLCAGDCFDFFGQQICANELATQVENCTLYQQMITFIPIQSTDLGVVGSVSCSTPCFDFQGVSYCLPGIYTTASGQCSDQTFQIVFEKDTLAPGQVGVLTCAEPCFAFEGVNYCQSGDYTTEDSCTVKHFSIGENFSLPATSSPQVNCLPNNTHFTVSFSISGLPPFKVNTQVLSGSNFVSDPLLNGSQYTFIVEQANGCQSLVNGTFSCASMCASDAGALSTSLLQGCAGQTVLQAQSVVPPSVTPDDVVEYWLQQAVGNVISQNSSGEFAFDPATMVQEQTYFVHRVVGQPDASGHPDPSNPCTQISIGQPLVFHAPPAIEISGADRICAGSVLDLTASGADSYIWADGAGGAEKTVETPSDAQTLTFSLVGTDARGCTGSATKAVDILENPVLQEVELYPPLCTGDHDGHIEINQVHGGLEPWRFALNQTAFGDKPYFDNLAPGTYTVAVEDANGCTGDSTVVFGQPHPSSLNIGPDQHINIGQTIALDADVDSQPVSVHWSTSNGLSQDGGLKWELQPLENIMVYCDMTDSNGCTARDEALIFVEIHDGIYRPGVLKLDADQGENQHFTIYAAEGWIQRIVSLGVYDRWGSLLWQNRDFAPNAPNLGWDGYTKGKAAPPGVYIYLAVVELANGERQTLKGDVTLVR